MLNASEFFGPRRGVGGSNNSLLKGSMLPNGVRELVVEVTGVRPAPEEWECKLLLDIKFVGSGARLLKGAKSATRNVRSWAVNTANGQLLRMFLDAEEEDLEELCGAQLRLSVVRRRNPQLDRDVKTFTVSAVRMPGSGTWEDVEARQEEEEEEEY